MASLAVDRSTAVDSKQESSGRSMPVNLRRPFSSGPDPSGEQMLVGRVRAGDEAAFEVVFRDHASAMLDFAYRCTRSADEAEDIVQAVFAKLWIGRERWEVRGPLGAYLMLATRNEVRDRVRHARVVEQHQATGRHEIAQGGPLHAVGADAELEAAETAAAIHATLTALAPQRRAVCILRWAHGLSYAEIAAKLDLAPKTVERHLTLGYKELREHIPHLPPLG
jgi:RNA polymerase sigma-70 factor (family 1)